MLASQFVVPRTIVHSAGGRVHGRTPPASVMICSPFFFLNHRPQRSVKTTDRGPPLRRGELESHSGWTLIGRRSFTSPGRICIGDTGSPFVELLEQPTLRRCLLPPPAGLVDEMPFSVLTSITPRGSICRSTRHRTPRDRPGSACTVQSPSISLNDRAPRPRLLRTQWQSELRSRLGVGGCTESFVVDTVQRPPFASPGESRTT